MKSDQSMPEPIYFKSEETQPAHRRIITEPDCQRRKIEQFGNQLQDFNENMSPHFSHDSNPVEVLKTFRSNLRKKFECLYEVTSNKRNPTLLNEIYTELYITESKSGEISNEHEVRQIETQSRRTTTEETPIKCNDIFKPLPEQDKHIRSVLTKGVAGIGKTVSVQKFILDWAEEKENQNFHLIFPLPFREINLMKDKTLSLLDLLHLFFPQTKEMEIFSDEYKVLFIFDGLDECRLSLDFHSSVRLCDVNESTSVDVMLTNLIKGNLFPSALIWITSRPAAADLIPSECVDRVTEVRGFTDPQKEEYFRKRIGDEEEFGLYQGKVYCFVHLSIQEHLAALYAHISITNNKRYVFKPAWFSITFKQPSLSELHQRAVNESLKSKNGHLDLFLRFLLGLSLESNQILLQDLLTQMRRCSYKKEKTVKYIKQKMNENLSTEKSINLIHCLNELGDDSLLQEIQHYVKSSSVGKTKLSSSQWAALVFVLLTSEKHLDELDLNKFIGDKNTADEVLVRLQLVIKETKKLK
ncbi:NLR family CARD domain-containing protein 3-like [Misgurnus anguillicaudatus]|uniref:NLR family CARD domain-containing protein 3-like n=1 Tax=Misgurnus anguillicaudatus TaxID=75329 RepID=UPI003CCFB240